MKLPRSVVPRPVPFGLTSGRFRGGTVSPSMNNVVLAPPGDCTGPQHRALQNEVNRWCNLPSQCTDRLSTQELEDREFINFQCRVARDTINRTCFRGGDQGHQIAADNAFNAQENCGLLIAQRSVRNVMNQNL